MDTMTLAEFRLHGLDVLGSEVTKCREHPRIESALW